MAKAITELIFRDDLFYSDKHTWAKIEGKFVKIGITDFAQDQLGEILFVELPAVGDTYKKNDTFGQAESAKSVSQLYMPLSGSIVEINNLIEDSAEYVNEEPYDQGWMIVVEYSDSDEIEGLLSKLEYRQQIIAVSA
ncbi:Glycine cleavage system H protein [bioreactor metagenome]|uniref:Glycine cleavage system H protein n=2 Tax=root TaxID=1 RepID=A0A098B840_DESHA|nr:glycine cleavage system protein GcvH [Desulfitobacterium hafniense]MEA5025479.1 glycine cleavage system protein GcvH [Desulfitobacterium hafniense]CDX04535.1 Glycine cleavage system H protein [Desulfitobacterium hafniense]